LLNAAELMTGLAARIRWKRSDVVERRAKPDERLLTPGRVYTYLYVSEAASRIRAAVRRGRHAGPDCRGNARNFAAGLSELPEAAGRAAKAPREKTRTYRRPDSVAVASPPGMSQSATGPSTCMVTDWFRALTGFPKAPGRGRRRTSRWQARNSTPWSMTAPSPSAPWRRPPSRTFRARALADLRGSSIDDAARQPRAADAKPDPAEQKPTDGGVCARGRLPLTGF
jgi:hypothetical protein